jgi:hypothetical protein
MGLVELPVLGRPSGPDDGLMAASRSQQGHGGRHDPDSGCRERRPGCAWRTSAGPPVMVAAVFADAVAQNGPILARSRTQKV